MKARASVFQRLAREAFERGDSLREIAFALLIPLGTIKTWRSRGKWVRALRSVPDETPAAVEKKDDHETYRGLKACHMPGARSGSKQMTFALFKRNLWPPAVWKVPPGLVGGELLMLLQERSCMNLRKKGEL